MKYRKIKILIKYIYKKSFFKFLNKFYKNMTFSKDFRPPQISIPF